MPIDIEIDAERRRINTRATGMLTVDDLLSYYQRLHDHPDYRIGLSELWDASGISGTQLTSDDLREFSSVTEPFTRQGAPVRVAILVSDDLGFGLARMYELLQTDSINRLKIVRSHEAAEAWLASGDEVAAGDPSTAPG